MKPYIIRTIPGALGLLLAASCSDSEGWTPGPQDTATGVSAYFPMPSKSSFIFDSEGKQEEMNVEITVSRAVTEAAASIPVILTSEVEGFSIVTPTAEFAQGEASTTVTVNCGGISNGVKESFTLTLPEDQTDIYGGGLAAVSYSVIKSEWKEISDQARYIYSYSDYSQMYPNTYGTLEHLDGTYMFKLTDFFGSGLDVTFECPSTAQTPFLPLNNAMFGVAPEGYEGLECWYLYDEANQTYPEWIPGDISEYPAISYLLFYGLSNYTSIYMNYSPDTLYGYIAFTCDVDFDNGDFAWGAFQADFFLKYNPFE
ncbi:MAG: hypothetical protein K2L45_07155 [Muribaculaceae bacterium]|nr:hypothetical protein [Muribaculaceae bacterium]MDE6633287.1 hypothetical protein [Muribaculaceae bacterium]